MSRLPLHSLASSPVVGIASLVRYACQFAAFADIETDIPAPTTPHVVGAAS